MIFEKITEALLAYAIPTASAMMLSWLTYTIRTSRKRHRRTSGPV